MIDTPRQALARLAAAQGVSLSALSRMLGRNVAYLQQYVGRGSPRVLPEAERRQLAQFLGVNGGKRIGRAGAGGGRRRRAVTVGRRLGGTRRAVA
ncbi:hypothetical protein AB5I41_11770 [Sphingomonas sp. MMS24-JH45]